VRATIRTYGILRGEHPDVVIWIGEHIGTSLRDHLTGYVKNNEGILEIHCPIPHSRLSSSRVNSLGGFKMAQSCSNCAEPDGHGLNGSLSPEGVCQTCKRTLELELENLYRSTQETSLICDALRVSLKTMRTPGLFDKSELEILAWIDRSITELQERFTDRRLDMIAKVAPEALAEAIEVAELIGAEPDEMEAIKERVYQRTIKDIREDPNATPLANALTRRNGDPVH